ncbi:MAG: glycosyltransferase family A protein [Chthoniobacteraceae bacterium]|jgi:glycosyltransferase involved in cell wall biosynthesis
MTTPAEPKGNCLLHVFLLTYNREKSFRRTLEAIAASALKEHALTVMDNCSTDGTARVCEEFLPLLPKMQVHRHERNIGFGANFLRSIEWSQGEYTWILCDDDTLYPDRVGALIELLRDHRPEACFVGGPRQDEWPTGLSLSPMDIQRKYGTFLTGQSFVPALVFKTSLIASADLVNGYFDIRTNFPQLIIGKKLLVNNTPCALLRPPVLTREDPAEKGTGHLDVIDGWSVFCRSLPPGLRRQAFYSTFTRPDMFGMVRQVLRMIVWTKIDGGNDPDYHLVRIGVNAGYPVRAVITLCRVACLVPGSVYHLMREGYRKIKYGWLGKPLPPTYHVPVVQDELRR